MRCKWAIAKCLMACCPTQEIEEGCENWPYTSSLDFQIFPISSPFKNCQSIWGNVLRIDFPIYIFHSFSCSGKSRLTCVWLLGKKKGMEKKVEKECQNGCSFWSTFYWFCMSHFGLWSSRASHDLFWMDNIECSCVPRMSRMSGAPELVNAKKMNQHFSVQ